MRTCYQTEISGFVIKIEQREDIYGRFRVTYGKQVTDGLTYAAAAKEFGLCVMHALACESKINDNGV